ncbi:MAG: GspE/PulE family protein, partial [Planctomycetota bacterium]
MAKLGEMLVNEGLITPEQLQEALSIQQRKKSFLGETLIEQKFLTEDQLLDVLTRQTGSPIIDLGEMSFDKELAKLIPWDMARKHNCLPVKVTGKILHVAMTDPTNALAIDDIAFRTNKTVKTFLTGVKALKYGWEQIYGFKDESAKIKKNLDADEAALLNKNAASDNKMAISSKDWAAPDGEEDAGVPQEMEQVNIDQFDDIVGAALDDIEVVKDKDEKRNTLSLSVAAEAPPIIKMVNGILLKAIEMGASDIHIEPFEKIYRVRFRIDGVLHQVMNLPVSVKNAVTSRLKIMSEIDITERRIPQDGRIKIKIARGKSMEFRVSSLPTVFGEKVVMRLLGQGKLGKHVNELGFSDKQLADVTEAVNNPYGMILVTGPTGSGKSTTLYTALNMLNEPDTNIVTAEDPVEFNLPGINQVMVKPAIGFTFEAALRSFLRQDPDIIMVGEMRDLETAAIGIKAALTGHLVMSTLHTNDAPSTITRFIDMGIDSFMCAAAIKLVIAQRLVRRLCPECAVPIESLTDQEAAMLSALGHEKDEVMSWGVKQAKGCDKYAKIGYKKRKPVFEVLPIN